MPLVLFDWTKCRQQWVTCGTIRAVLFWYQGLDSQRAEYCGSDVMIIATLGSRLVFPTPRSVQDDSPMCSLGRTGPGFTVAIALATFNISPTDAGRTSTQASCTASFSMIQSIAKPVSGFSAYSSRFSPHGSYRRPSAKP